MPCLERLMDFPETSESCFLIKKNGWLSTRVEDDGLDIFSYWNQALVQLNLLLLLFLDQNGQQISRHGVCKICCQISSDIILRWPWGNGVEYRKKDRTSCRKVGKGEEEAGDGGRGGGGRGGSSGDDGDGRDGSRRLGDRWEGREGGGGQVFQNYQVM